MNGIPQASLFLGIIPALILLYLSLKNYENYYKEEKIFLTFVIGIIAGFIAALIEIFTIQAGILTIILFPILEQIIKTMILNIRRLQGKKETVIYGLSLGLGFGSIFTPVSLILSNIQTESLTLILSIIGSLGIILFHGGTGIIIGYGVYTGKILKYYIVTILLHIPLTLFFYLTGVYGLEQFQISLIFYGLIIYWYVTKKIMPQILTSTQRRKRTKKSEQKRNN